MFERACGSSSAMFTDDDSEIKDLVATIEKNNQRLSEITRKIIVLARMRRAAWEQRELVEQSFLLSTEARRQRLEQLSRIMKPQEDNPQCPEHCCVHSDEAQTAEDRGREVRLEEEKYSMFSSLELSLGNCRLCSVSALNPQASDALDSFPSDSFFVFEQYETPNRGTGTLSERFSGADNELSRTPSDVEDAAPVQETPGVSDAELCERLIADLNEVHRRSVQVAGPGIVDPAFFWSDMLERVKQAVQPQGADLLGGAEPRLSFGHKGLLDVSARDSGMNSIFLAD